MKADRSTILVLVLCVLLSGGMAAGQTMPADKARAAKAREYLKLAQDNVAQAKDELLADSAGKYISWSQAELGDLAEAKLTATALHSFQYDAISEIARIEARKGDQTEALAYVRQAAKGLGASPPPDDLMALGEVEADFGDVEGARQLAAQMKPSWRLAKLNSAVARALARAGNLTAAKEGFAAAAAMLKEHPDSYAVFLLSDIALQLFDAGDVDGAMALAKSIPDQYEMAVTCVILSKGIARQGDLKRAQALFETARLAMAADGKGSNARILIMLAKSLDDAGDKESAKGLLVKAKAAATNMDSPSDRLLTLVSVGKAQTEIGDQVGASETLKAADEAIDKLPNLEEKTYVLWSLARLRAQDGEMPVALKSIAVAVQGKMNMHETAMIACELAKIMAQRTGPAADLSWIEKLGTPEEKGLAYAGAAWGMMDMSKGGDTK